MHDDPEFIRASFLSRSAGYLGLVTPHEEVSRCTPAHWPLTSQPGPRRSHAATRVPKRVEGRAAEAVR